MLRHALLVSAIVVGSMEVAVAQETLRPRRRPGGVNRAEITDAFKELDRTVRRRPARRIEKMTAPDLVLRSLVASPTQTVAGQRVTVSAQVQNFSTTSVRTAALSVVANDQTIYTKELGRLDAMETKHVSFSWQTPNDGVWRLSGLVRSGAIGAEKFTRNNRRSCQVLALRPRRYDVQTAARLLKAGAPMQALVDYASVHGKLPERFVPYSSGPYPFGQKQLTTPWPLIDGHRGPILKLASKGKGMLSWNVAGIPGAARIEYEITYGKTYSNLAKDEPGRVATGVVKATQGAHWIDFASFPQGLGTYYVRVAAQSVKGKDLALRSQPVIVRLVKVLPAPPPPPPPPGGAQWGKPNTTRCWLVDEIGNNLPSECTYPGWAFDNSPRYLQWTSRIDACAQARVECFAMVGHYYKPPPVQSLVSQGAPAGSPYFGIKGAIDLRNTFTKLTPNQSYMIRATPLNSLQQPCGSPSDWLTVAVAPGGQYVRGALIRGQYLGPGTAKGRPFPAKALQRIRITPHFGCSKNDHSKFYIQFSQAVDTASVEKALTIWPPWPDVEFKWYDGNSLLGVGHMSNIWFDTVYTFTLGKAARLANGAHFLAADIQWRAKTYPYVSNVIYAKLNVLTPEVTLPVDDKLRFSYQTQYAQRIEWNITNVYGYQTSGGPALQGGAFEFRVRGMLPKARQLTSKPYVKLIMTNALVDRVLAEPFKVKVLPAANADLAVTSVSFTSGHLIVGVQNFGPDTVPNAFLKGINLDVRLVYTPWGVIDSETTTLAAAAGNADLAPYGALSIAPTLKKIPGGFLTSKISFARALINLSVPTNLVHDVKMSNNGTVFTKK